MKPNERPIIFIVLPNGKEYQLKQDDCTPYSPSDEELALTALRDTFSRALSINVYVHAPKNNGVMKYQTLILWGDLLKNTYLRVEQY
jgi:hypothetical protein